MHLLHDSIFEVQSHAFDGKFDPWTNCEAGVVNRAGKRLRS